MNTFRTPNIPCGAQTYNSAPRSDCPTRLCRYGGTSPNYTVAGRMAGTHRSGETIHPSQQLTQVRETIHTAQTTQSCKGDYPSLKTTHSGKGNYPSFQTTHSCMGDNPYKQHTQVRETILLNNSIR